MSNSPEHTPPTKDKRSRLPVLLRILLALSVVATLSSALPDAAQAQDAVEPPQPAINTPEHNPQPLSELEQQGWHQVTITPENSQLFADMYAIGDLVVVKDADSTGPKIVIPVGANGMISPDLGKNRLDKSWFAPAASGIGYSFKILQFYPYVIARIVAAQEQAATYGIDSAPTLFIVDNDEGFDGQTLTVNGGTDCALPVEKNRLGLVINLNNIANGLDKPQAPDEKRRASTVTLFATGHEAWHAMEFRNALQVQGSEAIANVFGFRVLEALKLLWHTLDPDGALNVPYDDYDPALALKQWYATKYFEYSSLSLGLKNGEENAGLEHFGYYEYLMAKYGISLEEFAAKVLAIDHTCIDGDRIDLVPIVFGISELESFYAYGEYLAEGLRSQHDTKYKDIFEHVRALRSKNANQLPIGTSYTLAENRDFKYFDVTIDSSRLPDGSWKVPTIHRDSNVLVYAIDQRTGDPIEVTEGEILPTEGDVAHFVAITFGGAGSLRVDEKIITPTDSLYLPLVSR